MLIPVVALDAGGEAVHRPGVTVLIGTAPDVATRPVFETPAATYPARNADWPGAADGGAVVRDGAGEPVEHGWLNEWSVRRSDRELAAARGCAGGPGDEERDRGGGHGDPHHGGRQRAYLPTAVPGMSRTGGRHSRIARHDAHHLDRLGEALHRDPTPALEVQPFDPPGEVHDLL